MIHDVTASGLYVPSNIAMALELAEYELPCWEDVLATIEGPVATSFVATELVNSMLKTPSEVGNFTAAWAIGNPGPAGTEHLAAETAKQTFKWHAPTGARSIGNVAAMEWVEVKAKEEYTFVVLNYASGIFAGYAELTKPVAVEIGDTVRINVGALTLEVP